MTQTTDSSTNPLALIERMATDPNCDPAKLEKLLQVKEQWDSSEAKKAYTSALSRFQRDCPIIKREHVVKTKAGQNAYYYASYDDIYRQIRPILKGCELSVSFSSKSLEGELEITCTIGHVMGHSEQSLFRVPIPGMSQLVNDTQRAGSALSYAKRYSLCAALNIVVSDEDDDGHAAGSGPPITDHQHDRLDLLIAETNSDRDKLLEFFKIGALLELPQTRYGEAEAILQRKLDNKESGK